MKLVWDKLSYFSIKTCYYPHKNCVSEVVLMRVTTCIFIENKQKVSPVIIK